MKMTSLQSPLTSNVLLACLFGFAAAACGSSQPPPAEPDTSQEAEEAVEAVGTEVEQGVEATGDAIEEGADEAEDAVDGDAEVEVETD